MAKIRVGILYGGKSAEHEVSLQSAKNVFDALDREKYEPVLLGIDKTGRWHYGGAGDAALPAGAGMADADGAGVADVSGAGTAAGSGLPAVDGASRTLAVAPGSGGLVAAGGPGAVDVVFPILHGPFGEDGTVQGLLKLADIPFVGSGVLGSALGMDKDVMKRVLRDAGLPVAKCIVLRDCDEVPDFAGVAAELGLPLFVKPANMGSSVGVNKIHGESEYYAFIKDAFQYDRKIIIEEFIAGREIECAVLGNDAPEASVPGEIIAHAEFYSYEAKYLDENGAALEIPAKLPAETALRIRETAVQVFRVLGCEGLGRVDFFLRDDGGIIVNEINTMPGFTRISMYPKLWEASGVPYQRLIDRLIELAFERYRKEAGLRTSRV